jgi:hypothetical protein
MQHIYEVRPRKDKRSVDLMSDVLPFGRLRFAGSRQNRFDCPDDEQSSGTSLRLPMLAFYNASESDARFPFR